MANDKKTQAAQPETEADVVQPETAETAAAEEAVAGNEDSVGVDQLQAELEKAQAALKEAEEQVLRARADAQNIRRRAEQDVEKAHKFALEKFANELLPVVDNLERGLESAGQENVAVEAIREGVEMTLGMFQSALGKFNVEALDPAGAAFDPQHHQAMSMVESPDAAPNTVLHVMQKGYLLNGRLLRPAMVVVAKAPAGQATSIDEKA
ncbi:nucleotide exchange factor GrpE [Motiliproteus sediminis]|uniref:nucleotide exchange factor GrpE n=1 Tax=Motiliproteus sediminis TaxID=1468178 RepID=UPI001AEF68ED|nr:nucleotide exchange factor GrpE [Motiliproteus sediminis]